MSKYYDRIKQYYALNYWIKAWVWDAVQYEWLTTEEYELITKEEFITERP